MMYGMLKDNGEFFKVKKLEKFTMCPYCGNRIRIVAVHRENHTDYKSKCKNIRCNTNRVTP